MAIELRESVFDPWQELQDYRRHGLGVAPGSYGATAVFVGTMRDFNEGDAVRSLFLEHYPGMTERHLETICREAAARWDLLDTLILHRVGAIAPDDTIVLVAAWSAHRAEAFAACRYLIEELKHRAPFWKKEELPTGTRWVESNTPG